MNIEALRIQDVIQKSSHIKISEDLTKFCEKMFDSYANKIDVVTEIKKMDAWLESNPRKRYRNYKRFVNGWLSRARRW